MYYIKNLLKIIFMMFTCVLLINCNNTLTYDYLIMHPAELQTAYSACQSKDTPSCIVIKQAAHDIGEIIYEQTSNPEQFGKKVMAIQSQLEMMKKNNAIDRKIYDEQLQKLQMMYAVLGAQGPET